TGRTDGHEWEERRIVSGRRDGQRVEGDTDSEWEERRIESGRRDGRRVGKETERE
ncbi:hypothetical protein PoB_007656700, partial [Plakobranchus ocellatus]